MSNNFDGPVILDQSTAYIGFGRVAGSGQSDRARIYYVTTDPNGIVFIPAVTDGSIAIQGAGGAATVWQYDGSSWSELGLGGGGAVVFRPAGAENASGVYNTWSTLVDAVAATGLPTTIYIDNTLTAPIVPAGTWTFPERVEFVGLTTSGQPARLGFADGAFLDGNPYFVARDLELRAEGAGDGVFGGPAVSTLVADFSNCSFNATSRPIVQALFPTFRLSDCTMSTTPIAEPLALGFGGQVRIEGSCSINASLLSGASGGATITVSASSSFAEQLGLLAAPTVTYSGPAEQPFTTLTAPGTLTGRRAYVFDDAVGFVQPLPDPARYSGPLRLKNIGAGAITLTSSGTVNPSTLNTGESAVFMSDGTNWEGF